MPRPGAATVEGVPATSSRFLVVLDADSTLIRNEVIELIADEAGRGAEVAAATEAAMRGEVDFATSLRSRVEALAGVPVSAFAHVLARIEPTPGVRELIDAVHERGGRVDGDIVDAEGKALALSEWADETGVALSRTIAIGDGANDLRMMAVAGLGVAFNAKPAVRERADLVVGPVDLSEVIALLP